LFFEKIDSSTRTLRGWAAERDFGVKTGESPAGSSHGSSNAPARPTTLRNRNGTKSLKRNNLAKRRNEKRLKSLKTHNLAKLLIHKPVMISIAYDDTRETFRFVWRNERLFGLRAGSKRIITAGRRSWSNRPSWRGACAVAGTREWRRKPLKTLKMDSEMASRQPTYLWQEDR
jgi:hypothetical protein